MTRPARAWALVAACAVGLVPGLWLASGYSRAPVERLRTALRAIDAEVGPAIDWTRIAQRSERDVFFLLSRAIESREATGVGHTGMRMDDRD